MEEVVAWKAERFAQSDLQTQLSHLDWTSYWYNDSENAITPTIFITVTK